MVACEGYYIGKGDSYGMGRIQGGAAEQTWTALQNLRHMGPVREYVRSYSTLMLEIPDMSKADRR